MIYPVPIDNQATPEVSWDMEWVSSDTGSFPDDTNQVSLADRMGPSAELDRRDMEEAREGALEMDDGHLWATWSG